jgi:hypothetical protein
MHITLSARQGTNNQPLGEKPHCTGVNVTHCRFYVLSLVHRNYTSWAAARIRQRNTAVSVQPMHLTPPNVRFVVNPLIAPCGRTSN